MVLLVVLIPVLVLFVVPLWNAPQQAFTFAAFLDLLSSRLGSVEAQFSLVQHNFDLVWFGLVFFCLCSGLQHNLSLARGKRFIMFVCSFVPSFVRWFVCLFACCDSIRFDCRLISCYQTSPVNHREHPFTVSFPIRHTHTCTRAQKFKRTNHKVSGRKWSVWQRSSSQDDLAIVEPILFHSSLPITQSSFGFRVCPNGIHNGQASDHYTNRNPASRSL